MSFLIFSACKSKYPSIIVKFLPSINISYGVAEATKNFQLFSALRRKHPDIIKGIDLSGDPTKGSFSDYREIYAQARAEGFRLALHCAEAENESEILEMLEFMTSEDRIGHGTFIDGIFMRQQS
jgi:adenosine deaminase